MTAYLEENFKLAPAVEPAERPQHQPKTDKSAEEEATKVSTEDERPKEAAVSDEPAEPLVEQTQEESTQHQTEPAKLKQPPKPPKPTLIERFAAACGFKTDHDGRFFNSSGDWIGRTRGALFPWERRSSAGQLLTYYLDVDHCLEQEPVQLAADLWHALNELPGQYSLILASTNGAPVEISGKELKSLENEGKLKLYPASYRIALEIKEHA